MQRTQARQLRMQQTGSAFWSGSLQGPSFVKPSPSSMGATAHFIAVCSHAIADELTTVHAGFIEA